ncbi:hypothetical protein XM53_10315 [Roseovarius atlanticus]|uniref:Uncharacterized protein n=2 Tax=Roseovarius atlanticus TaxID=1641875 RepID=A0A0T5NV81_9RHOB|nr:hypothetical protein XM53_10315 [Roseovarius atlanticus]
MAVVLFFAAPVVAQDAERPVVVELFTSQGCSSCPAADKFFHKLAGHEGVIALSLHVDYWDYIGWKDSFASPAHTKRQRAYAKAADRRVVYTPQMVINGKDDVVGNRPMDVVDVIDRHRRLPRTVALELSRQGESVLVEAESLKQMDGPLTVQLVRFRPESTVHIKRGENAGRTISYANVVTEMRSLGDWDGSAPLRVTAEAGGDAPVAVLLQNKGGAGLIEAAAVLE